MAKLQLPDVTLLIMDTKCHELARLAIEDSIRDIDFGDVIIFSDLPIHVPGTRWVKVEPMAERGAMLRIRLVRVARSHQDQPLDDRAVGCLGAPRRLLAS